MKNGIYNITHEDLVERGNTLFDDKTHVAVIDGAAIPDKWSLIDALANAFEFPEEESELDYSYTIEYLEDLMWIREPRIVFVIHHYDDLLSGDTELKKTFDDDLKDIVGWWSKDVIGHMVGGYPRSFRIYLGD